MKLLISAALVVLAGSAALFADETRIWTNNTDRPWTIELKPRDQAEKGNMEFTEITGRNLPERPTLDQVRALTPRPAVVVLGEAGGVKRLTLPKYSRWLVEFTHTKSAFYHAFRVVDIYGSYAGEFACDDPWHNRSGFSLSSIGKEGPKAFLALNGAAGGDLAINPSGQKLINGTRHALKVLVVQRAGVAPSGHLRYQPMTFSPGRDFWVNTINARDSQLDGDPEGVLVPPGEALEFWGVGPLTRAALEVTVCAAEPPHAPVGGGWDLNLTLDAGQPYPANAQWACPKAEMTKALREPELTESARRGQLQLRFK